MKEFVLGRGMFNWPRNERVSDRYGMVSLYGIATQKPGLLVSESMDENTLNRRVVRAALGKSGKLVARVLETRDSDHIGDLFRGFHPVTPEVGEEIELGAGTLVEEATHETYAVGLRPDDGRDTDWLDPAKLYRAHSQTVELVFVED